MRSVRRYIAPWRLDNRCSAVSAAMTLAVEFFRLVRERNHGALAAWLGKAESSDLRELREIAAGLAADRAAFEAAVHLQWSNGQTEGQLTKPKLLKRDGYGRAKADLLLRRLAHAADPVGRSNRADRHALQRPTSAERTMRSMITPVWPTCPRAHG